MFIQSRSNQFISTQSMHCYHPIQIRLFFALKPFPSARYNYQHYIMHSKALQGSKTFLKATQYVFSTSLSESYVRGKPMVSPFAVSAGEVLLNMTEKFPGRVALYSYEQNKKFTYQQLTNLAVKLALGLRQNFQLEPKDRIGVYSLNKWEWYVLQLAASFADLILVNINPSYRSDELAYTFEKVRIKVLFISDSFKNSNYLDILRQTIPELRNSNVDPFEVKSKKFEYLQSVVRFNDEKNNQKIKGFINFSDLLNENYSLQKLPIFPDSEDPANIQFTSGTTGRPKAATLSHSNILNNGYIIGQRCRYTEKDNICVPVPLYHCFGMVMGNLAALTRGGSVTYVCQGFDPAKVLEAVSAYSCTSLYGVPTMFGEYLRVFESNPEKYNIRSLRTGIIAGSLAPEALMHRILNVLKISDITNCYGMTETSPVTFQTSPTDSFANKTTSVGTVLSGLEAKLVDKDGKTCPIGTAGEYLLKGWAVMKGYWEDAKANEKSLIDGWMYSGDIGVMDSEGYLTIVGRNKDMIIRGGENVYPKQVQQFLNNRLKNENVMDVQVVGVSDEKYGEEIAAVIKLKSLADNTLTGVDILNVCKNRIAHYKVPKYLMLVTEYPLTVTGKVQKFLLREQLEDMKKTGKLASLAIK